MKDVIEQIHSHASIRKYKSDPISEELLERILVCGLRGSSSGNMQTWSVISSTDLAQRTRLYELHQKQEMILQAPVVLTFCADTARMRKWLNLRKAKDGFDDLLGFLAAAFDAIIAAQNIALAAESNGLGICYMGSTLFASAELINELQLPPGVIPVTAMVLGYPDEAPEIRDRLPISAIWHKGAYQHQSNDEIDKIYQDRDVKGWIRYHKMYGEEYMAKLQADGIHNLAQFYTSDYKYGKSVFARCSIAYLKALKDQAFWNF